MSTRRALVLASILTACEGSAPPDAPLVDAGSDAGASWRACDPLVPEACGLPFPSDVYTVPDPDRATGLRLDFVPGALPSRTRDAAPFEALDGFSPASSPMTFLPGATATGLPGPLEIARSLEADSPTVLVDLDTMERVAHFSEIDQAYPGEVQRALLLRPAAGLTPGHRYAVAVRSVVDASGSVVPPSPVFVALRDGAESADPAVLERRADYEALFTSLGALGIERSTLQIAWSFTVGSREAITGSLVRMRDETLAAIGTEGASYTLTEVEVRGPEDVNIAYRVRGTIEVPLYLTRATPGGVMRGTYMALTTDVQRGVLLVPGQSYSFLLQRNRGGWDQFSPLFEANYGAIDILRCLALMQLLWDHAEPSGFTPYIRDERFPGTPAHDVLMVVAINDHQVTTLAAHAMARTIGVPNLGPPNRDLYGLEVVTGPTTGSAMIEIDFGVPEVPRTNTVPPEGPDPHTMVTAPSWVLPTLDTYFRSGEIATTCDGPCDPE